MSRYKVRIETYFGYNEGTFDAESKSKAVYKMYKYLFKKPFTFKEFLEIFNPRAEKVADDSLLTWCEYGNIYGFRNNLSFIGMMKRGDTKCQ